jgi:uncharacterized protein (UPF0332 family)
MSREYLEKTVERLAGAESELANRRFNNCANRCYYACFLAAIAALLEAGIQARSPGGLWRHEYIQAQFVGQLINRRSRYPATLRRSLSDNLLLRQKADYETDMISEIQAHRAVRRTRQFVDAIRSSGGIT